MPRWSPVHPAFTFALRRLAKEDVPSAEALRRLIPIAERLGQPRPSYWWVRRFMIDERLRLELRRADRERLIERTVVPLLAGRVPRP